MNLNKKANSFVYAILLVNLALILAYIVYNNTFIIGNDLEYRENESEFSDILLTKGNNTIELVKQYNSNGLGTDIISCPSEIIAESLSSTGTLIRVNETSSELVNNYSHIYCSFNLYSIDGIIDYNSEGFTNITFNNEVRPLTSSGGYLVNEEQFTGGLFLSFLENYAPDGYSDIMNSDDYRSGSSSNKYPNSYYDDDVIPRLFLRDNILPHSPLYNVFWSNSKTIGFTNNNPYNNDDNELFGKLSELENGHLYLDFGGVSPNYNIKIVEFDRGIYDREGSLVPTTTYYGNNLNSNSGFLENISGNININKNINANTMSFDLGNRDYAIFVENLGDSPIGIQISAYDSQGDKKIYINPIDDSKNNIIEVLVNHIIFRDNVYYSQQKVLSGVK